jgi:UDP-3-O-[3-hydroxymyristoyl] N-acetylglucosamine deacetylase
MILQQSLKSAVTVHGIGLHSGKPTQLTLRPARANHGIVFVRTDLEGSPQIPAHYSNVTCTRLATTISHNGVSLSTVEHVLAALQGLGIDNAIIEVNGPEVPILDGSSAPFCEVIRSVGVVMQGVPRRVLALRRKVEVKIAEKWAVAEPSARLEIFGSVEWDHPAIGYQEYHYVEGRTPFEELASARTFCLLRDVEMMQKAGLARGGSLENAVVLDDALVLNPEGLRFPNEMARHKVLDALGDFKLAGVAIQAYFRMHRAGHELHDQLLKAIFANPDCFEIIDGSPEVEKRRMPQIRALAHGLVASVS